MTNPYTEIRNLLGDGQRWIKGKCVIPNEKPEKVQLCLVAAVVRIGGTDYAALRDHLMAIIEVKHPGRFTSLAGYNDASKWPDISDTLAQAEASVASP